MVSTPNDDARDDLLRRIRALRGQASGTGFAGEADAYLAKAAELMARHRITEAMLEQAHGHGAGRGGAMGERRVNLGRGPYVNARLHLLHACGHASGCVVLHSTGFDGKTGYVIGARDTARAELLYTSLLSQAVEALSHEAVPRGQHAATFRRSFLFAWAEQVDQRLRQAMATATAQADATPAEGPEATRSVALVLSDRRRVVDDFVTSTYGAVRAGRGAVAAHSQAGRTAGQRAAHHAELHPTSRLSAGAGALPR